MTPVSNLSCTQFEMWTGKKPNLSRLRVIGCKAFCQIQKSARGGKFAAVGYLGVLISYGVSNPTYRVWNSTTHKVYDVAVPAFDEDAQPGWWRDPAATREEEDTLVFLEFPSLPVVSSPTALEVVDESEQGSPADDDTPHGEEVLAQATPSEAPVPASGSAVPPEAQPATPAPAPVLRLPPTWQTC